MTKREIEKLGFESGVDAVNEHVDELRRYCDEETAEATEAEIKRRLLWTLEAGQLAWDDAARSAGAARIDKVFGAKNTERYYAAYNRGAETRIRELTA
jgi:uncharacterized protein YciW